MDLEQKLNRIKILFLNKQFPEAQEALEDLKKEAPFDNFQCYILKLIFSHCRILTRFTSKNNIDFSNFADQLGFA